MSSGVRRATTFRMRGQMALLLRHMIPAMALAIMGGRASAQASGTPNGRALLHTLYDAIARGASATQSDHLMAGLGGLRASARCVEACAPYANVAGATGARDRGRLKQAQGFLSVDIKSRQVTSTMCTGKAATSWQPPPAKPPVPA